MDLVSVVNEVQVEQDWETTWQRVGDFLAIGELFGLPCSYVTGSGEIGSVRRIGDDIVEPLVGLSSRSYTYSQTEGSMVGHHYHGTVAVDPTSEGSCRLTYTLLYDASGLSDELREKTPDRLAKRFTGVLEKMKESAEA